MIQKLEKYADNLESIVQQRTAELIDEKHKTDMLLYRMLPPYARSRSLIQTFYRLTFRGAHPPQRQDATFPPSRPTPPV